MPEAKRVWVDCSMDSDLGIGVIAVACEGKLLATQITGVKHATDAEKQAIKLGLNWIDNRPGYRVYCDNPQAVKAFTRRKVKDGYRGDNQAHRAARHELKRIRALLGRQGRVDQALAFLGDEGVDCRHEQCPHPRECMPYCYDPDAATRAQAAWARLNGVLTDPQDKHELDVLRAAAVWKTPTPDAAPTPANPSGPTNPTPVPEQGEPTRAKDAG